MTIKEIEKEHNNQTTNIKSIQTIYRYLKELAEYKLVIEVGKKVELDKKGSEILYNRSARLYYTFEDEICEWDKKEEKLIYLLLKNLLGNNKMELKGLEDKLKSLNSSRVKSFKQLSMMFQNEKVLDKNEEIQESMNHLDWEDTSVLINEVAFFAWLLKEMI
jgi:hypothetical protein